MGDSAHFGTMPLLPVRPHLRRLLALATLLAFVGLAVPGAVLAQPPTLSGTITDQTGVLSGHEAEIQAAVDKLRADRGVDLFVLYVPTTGGQTVTAFADATAQKNSLGGRDSLLVVALNDRTDALWVGDGLSEVTNDEIDTIISGQVEPKLRSGDYAGAAVAAAEGLGAALAPPTDVLNTLIPVALVVIGGVILLLWIRGRVTARRESEERDRRTGQLAREANAALIATDERIRDAQQEVGFVEAEYGEDDVAPLRTAITNAQGELKAAFGIRQRLDDSEPETPEQREQMLREIVDRTKRAQAALDAEAKRIAGLRDLERDAPALLDRLPGQIDAVEGRLPGAETALTSLRGYPDAVWAPVKGNLEEARKGIAGARAAVERGRAALPGDARTAARQVRTAQEGVTGAATLLDAIDKLTAAVRDATQRLPAELAAAEADIEAAQAGVRQAASTGAGGRSPAAGAAAAGTTATTGGATATSAPSQADLEGQVRAAQAALAKARDAAAPPLVDPLAAMRAASDARRIAGQTLAAVRQDAEQRARTIAALDAALTTASSDIDRAGDFVASRRSGVGRRARTRLAEAEASLATAQQLRTSDPAAALQSAQRAERLAEEAYDLARSDFDDWDNGGPRWGGGGGGSDVAAAVLGGLIGSILSGGGRGGGWGGSPWGGPGPFGGGGGPLGGGGGGWGGGRSRGGGFGGFGGGGGGLGGLGGGGRSRGGRW